mmetsp:Transcript_27888/g.77984  ORF Transcript_27888/g.77984 Transcript_27888/m.77984 type:complete len:225 (+) Transcript_27888:829-1503(+)
MPRRPCPSWSTPSASQRPSRGREQGPSVSTTRPSTYLRTAPPPPAPPQTELPPGKGELGSDDADNPGARWVWHRPIGVGQTERPRHGRRGGARRSWPGPAARCGRVRGRATGLEAVLRSPGAPQEAKLQTWLPSKAEALSDRASHRPSSPAASTRRPKPAPVRQAEGVSVGFRHPRARTGRSPRSLWPWLQLLRPQSADPVRRALGRGLRQQRKSSGLSDPPRP